LVSGGGGGGGVIRVFKHYLRWKLNKVEINTQNMTHTHTLAAPPIEVCKNRAS